VIAGLLGLALFASLAVGGAGQERAGAAEGAATARRAPRDEAFKMIDAYMVSNLQESLELTDPQYVKLLPLVQHLQSDRRAVLVRKQQALMELRRVLAAGAATEPKVEELLKEVKGAETDESSLLRKDRDAVDAALTPLQQAKFRILEIDVERKIREVMNEIRAERRGQAPARRPGARSPQP
jgi:Spy/CpxP family protein refolding chaperone